VASKLSPILPVSSSSSFQFLANKGHDKIRKLMKTGDQQEKLGTKKDTRPNITDISDESNGTIVFIKLRLGSTSPPLSNYIKT
jgi:hypothetical protein